MASMWLTYSGMSGGQHLTFKPTMMAVLLASGYGSYYYYDHPVSTAPQEAQAQLADASASLDVGFYGSAKAAVPRPKVTIDPVGLLPITGEADKAPDALLAPARLDSRSLAPQQFWRNWDQADSERIHTADLSTQPAAVPGAAAALPAQTAPVHLANPSGLTAEPAHLPLKTGPAAVAAQSSLAASLVATSESLPQSAMPRESLAGSAGTNATLAKFSPPLPTRGNEPAAAPVALVAQSQGLVNAQSVAKTGASAGTSEAGQRPLAAVQTAQASIAPASAKTQSLAAATEVPHKSPVAALAAPPVAAAEPARSATSHSQPTQSSLALAPIAFRLAAPAKSKNVAAGLTTSRHAERARSAAALQSDAPASRKLTRMPDRLVGEFIFHQVTVQLNDSPAGKMDVRIGGDASLSIRVGSLLSVVKGQMDQNLFAAMSSAAGADEYVSFRQLRAAGIDVRYEPAGDRIVLTAD